MGRALVPDLLPAFNHWMPSRSSAPTLLYGRKTVPAFSPTDPPAALSSPPYRTVHSDDMIARHTQAHRVGNPVTPPQPPEITQDDQGILEAHHSIVKIR